MIVKDILRNKGNKVYSVHPDATVYDAIKKMSELNVGSLMVMKDEQLVGIISDRDYRDKVILMGRASKSTNVHEIMTSGVYCVKSTDSVQTCMAIMTDKKIRHLPVMDDEKLKGVISIGDLVKSIIDKQKVEINNLTNFITGNYPG